MAGLGNNIALSVQQEDLLVARVGPHFIGLFYNAIENQRRLMRNFFADNAMLVWNGQRCYTKEEIGKFYDSLPACRIDVGNGPSNAEREAEQKAKAEDFKNRILNQVLTQEARARLNTIAVAKPEKAVLVENMIVRMVQMGQIQSKWLCDSVVDETVNTDDVWSSLVDSKFITATDTFQEFVDAWESKLPVCDEVCSDDVIVAAVRGSVKVATDDESGGEDDVDPAPKLYFLFKDALECLTKGKKYCTKNNLSKKSLQCFSFVEDDIVRSAVLKIKIMVFFR
ncbi:hypothetical protein HPB51_019985 [Rhipicephalus microplus]|uniref:Nuclear transport factor 2 domain-containing protein n=1 Tax=Rhipicephalus microplus TaxID=6941 RepID=A0A9J6DCJ8_RHIMP|nr:hypothetical protein HPB51_019985 [Rhipicephalus microplus]